jgi:hypothetical protein
VKASPRARAGEGQASIELLATVPALVTGAVIALQLAITGYSLHLADGAAEAAALAVAAGTDPVAAATAAMPGWAADGLDVSVEESRVEVSVRPPAPHPSISAALEVSAAAWALGADGG